MIAKLLYILPLFGGIFLLFAILVRKMAKTMRESKNVHKFRLSSAISKLWNKLAFFSPRRGTKVFNWYSDFTKYSRISVENFFRVKIVLFLMMLLIVILGKFTNISMYTKEIYTKFEYYTDMMYQYNGEITDKKLALEQELKYLNIALAQISKSEVLMLPKEDIQAKISGLIPFESENLIIPRDTVANKVYYRLYDYHSYRKMNFPFYLIISLLVGCIPELIMLIFNIFAISDTKRELRFLKKLIIVNGSIKPVDFMELLHLLIDKSRYFRKVLEDIEDKNKKNTVDNRVIYQNYIRSAKSLEVKLFYEKLDQANNYDFDQAIVNIDNEFKLEKREQIRKTRKRIDAINALGIMGYIVLIVILMMYMLIPWMNEYKGGQFF